MNILNYEKLRHVKVELLCAIFFYTLLSTQAEGIQLMLTSRDIKEAVQYGIENEDLSNSELLKAWRIDLGYGVGSATLVTPYASLIILAREAALNFRKPTEHEIEHALKDREGELFFGCSLYGDEIDFVARCKAYLWYKGGRREPIYAGLPSSVDYTTNYPASPKFFALSSFHFSMEGIGPNDTVTLVIINQKGEELRFPFDLSKLK